MSLPSYDFHSLYVSVRFRNAITDLETLHMCFFKEANKIDAALSVISMAAPYLILRTNKNQAMCKPREVEQDESMKQQLQKF